MTVLSVRLFGKLQVQQGDQVLDSLPTQKVQELFAYLLLSGKHFHRREILATLLWDKISTTQSLKYLRHTLWQLQLSLDQVNGSASLVWADPEWIGLNPQATLQLDVTVFKQASACAQGLAGQVLDPSQAQVLHEAVELYQGDLLEGWYQDWCLYERERLQNLYLAMLGKLMVYCEAHQLYETGLAYGARILRYDRAHEPTHRQLMRLYYLAQDRTGALHQYERCAAALKEELDVKPDRHTVTLYEQIRADHFDLLHPLPVETSQIPPAGLPEVLNRLKELRTTLVNVERRLEQEIQTVELLLHS